MRLVDEMAFLSSVRPCKFIVSHLAFNKREL